MNIEGDVAPGYERVADAFSAAFAGQPTMGAALAIFHDGMPVVDVWGGMADERDGRAWTKDTPSVVFSCTKGLMSILAADLVQAGLLDYDAPVEQYWPEFAAEGKAGVLVSHVLAHRAGLSAPRTPMSLSDVLDWPTVTSALAAQKPLWSPGEGYAYHALTHGWLIGEIIRRITGRDVREQFDRVLSQPLSAEAWLGAPPTVAVKAAHLQVGDTLAELTRQQVDAIQQGGSEVPHRAMTLGNAFPPELVGPDTGFNDPLVRQAEIPGAGGIATARGLAKIWSATVVETDGVRLLGDEVIERATTVQTEGPPVYEIPGPWPRWGMGFQLDSDARTYLGSASFGHDGAGGQVAFADADADVGFAFLTNRMEAIEDHRATRIIEALQATLRTGIKLD